MKLKSNSIIEKYSIFKRYPSSLDINIEKTKFLARIIKDGQFFILALMENLLKMTF
jgi:cell division protein FtsQ